MYFTYIRGKAHATISKVIMGNGGFNGCLSEPQGVSAWWKEAAETGMCRTGITWRRDVILGLV